MNVVKNISKICYKCHQEKPIIDFNKDRNTKDGLRCECKICKKQYQSEHKKEIKLWKKQYNLEHKKEIQLYNKKYHLEHKKEINCRRKKYQQQKCKTDSSYRILKNLRVRIWDALKGYCKSAHTMELVGCTIEEFKLYLQSLFKSGMTLDNNGIKKWHLHHIKQCSTFDMSDPKQQQLCFHYTNMIPVWEDEHELLHVKSQLE